MSPNAELELGQVDGWRIYAKLGWGYDDECEPGRKWAFGNVVELTALKDDDDRDSGITHVRYFKLHRKAMSKLLELLK